MEKFDWSCFKLKIAIEALPSKVFRAWTNPRELCAWFAYKARVELKKNGKMILTDIYRNAWELQILDFKSDSFFHFTFGMNDEQVKITLKKSGKNTICELHQFNMKTTPNHRWNTHMEQRAGWTFFLANLKAWLEHGIDLRSHDRKKGYINGYINS